MLKLAGTLLQTNDAEPDIAAFLGIFHRVGKQIDQNLVHPGFVSNQLFVAHACHRDMKILLFGLGHGLYNGVRRGYQVAERKFLKIQHNFAALNLRDV